MNKEILRLAIPNIISNVSIPLLSSVDTSLMGKLSASHLAAVGLASMAFNFFYWNFSFLRMGTTGLTAQAYGAKDQKTEVYTLYFALLVALAIGFALILFKTPLSNFASGIMNVSSSEISFFKEYILIRLWAAPAGLMLYSLLGWFYGEQNTTIPMFVTIVGNIINISCSWVLVHYYQLEIAGVAWGTVIAQYISLILGFVFVWSRFRQKLFVPQLLLLFQLERVKKQLLINSDIFLRTLCLTIVFGFVYSASSAMGTIAAAAVTVLLQFVNWMSYAVDGFAFAAESLVGKYKGAKDRIQTHKAIRYAMIYGAFIGLLFAIGYGVFTEQLIGIFTNQPEVKDAVINLSFYLVFLPLVGTACYIWDGVFVGLTATKAMRNTMIFALIIFFVTYFILKSNVDNLSAIWIALLMFLIARGVAQTIIFQRYKLELK